MKELSITQKTEMESSVHEQQEKKQIKKEDVIRALFSVDVENCEFNTVKIESKEYYNIVGKSKGGVVDLGLFDIHSTDALFDRIQKIDIVEGNLVTLSSYELEWHSLKVIGSDSKKSMGILPVAQDEAIVIAEKDLIYNESGERILDASGEFFFISKFEELIVYVDEEKNFSELEVLYEYLRFKGSTNGPMTRDYLVDLLVEKLVSETEGETPDKKLEYWEKFRNGINGIYFVNPELFEKIVEYIEIKNSRYFLEKAERDMQAEADHRANERIVAKEEEEIENIIESILLVHNYENGGRSGDEKDFDYSEYAKAAEKLKKTLPLEERLLVDGLWNRFELVDGQNQEKIAKSCLLIALNEIMGKKSELEKTADENGLLRPVLDLLSGKKTYSETVIKMQENYKKMYSKFIKIV